MKKRRLICGMCVMAISSASRLARCVDRHTNARIGAAAADIGNRRVDIGVARLRIVLEECRYGHDHSALAIPALRDVVGDPSLLYPMQAGACREAFDRRDLASFGWAD